MIGSTIARYRILELLGAGGMGEVYRARDDRLGRDVAIKVLPAGRQPDPQLVDRFIREARAASSLNHPNIVTIYEAGETDRGHFIVMELVRGRTLRELAGELAYDAVRDLAVQIAKGLATAHEAGIVHRDIKPENLMVRDDGYAKILDFGVARLPLLTPEGTTVAPDTTGRAGQLVGTVRYMSPEQASGGTVETPTDVFSLGIVLYELATGRYPFEPLPPYGVLDALLTGSPPAPERLNPELPREFGALLLRMLDRHPDRRPAAHEIAELLEGASRAAPTAFAHAAARRRLVGREREHAQLCAALDDVAAGRGLLVTVAGEAGIGKSTLVEAFLAERQQAGVPCQIARGRCSERLAGTEAYLPFLDALQNLVRTSGTGAASSTRLLKTVAPLWYLQIAPQGVDESSAARLAAELQSGSRERLKRQLLAFFEEATRSRPMVLFFDDVHWVDVSTVDLLSYLVTRLDHAALLIIATYRADELRRQKHPFLHVKQDLQARGQCREIQLDFLSVADIETYLDLEFEGHRFPDTMAALVHGKTEGSPLFLVDLLRDLRNRGTLAVRDGRWTLTEQLPDLARSLPESVRSMIQRKIDALDEADRRLLLAASVQGYEFEGAVAARVLRVEPADVEEQLDRVDRVHAFVRPLREVAYPDGTLTLRYRFVHVLYQNLLYASLTPARRAALARAVASALEAFYGGDIAPVAAEVAVLYETARAFDRAADHFLTAARQRALVFAHQEAIMLAQRGLDALDSLADTPERRRRELALLLGMGVPLILTKGYGHPRVHDLYSRARSVCERFPGASDSERFRTLWGLWNYLLITLELEAARSEARGLLAIAQRTGDIALLVESHKALGLTAYFRGEFREAHDHFRRILSLYDPEAHRGHALAFSYDPAVGARSCDAWVLWTLGSPDRARAESDEALGFARRLGHATTLAYALLFSAVLHQFRGEWDEARRDSEELQALSADKDLAHFEAAGRVFVGLARAQQGKPDEGVRVMQEGLAAYQRTGAQTSRPRIIAQLAEQLGRTGRLDEAFAAITGEIAATRSARFYLAEVLRIRGELHLARDPPEDAEAEASLHQALRVARKQQANAYALRAAVSLARLWRRQQRWRDAYDLLHGIYSGFSEGFTTADLVEAKSLLEGLADHVL